MTNINPNDYEEEMKKCYRDIKASQRWDKKYDGPDISFDKISFLKDGKHEFLVGTSQKREDIPKNNKTDEEEHTNTESTIFVMPITKGKLSEDALLIEANSSTRHFSGNYDRDICEIYWGGDTKISFHMGNKERSVLRKELEFNQFSDVSQMSTIAAATVQKKDAELMKICDRFLEPRGEASRLLKAEKERIKRVQQIGKLRKVVQKKWNKEEQKKQKEQEKRRKKEQKAFEKVVNATKSNFLDR